MGSRAQGVITSSMTPSWQCPADKTTPGWASHQDFVNCLDGARSLCTHRALWGANAGRKSHKFLSVRALAITRTLNEHEQLEQRCLCSQVMEFWFVLAASS